MPGWFERISGFSFFLFFCPTTSTSHVFVLSHTADLLQFQNFIVAVFFFFQWLKQQLLFVLRRFEWRYMLQSEIFCNNKTLSLLSMATAGGKNVISIISFLFAAFPFVSFSDGLKCDKTAKMNVKWFLGLDTGGALIDSFDTLLFK